MFRLFDRSKALFLVGLLSLSLVGTQAVKDAPWHDHSQHVADCALCHLQFSEDAVPATAPLPRHDEARTVLHAATHAFAALPLFSHYQSRAPPLFLLFR